VRSVCDFSRTDEIYFNKEKKMDAVQNLAFKIEGNVLTITMDVSKTFGLSKSGKTTSVASTKGNRPLGDMVKNCPKKFAEHRLGINCYVK